jgi:hypothetical protein
VPNIAGSNFFNVESLTQLTFIANEQSSKGAEHLPQGIAFTAISRGERKAGHDSRTTNDQVLGCCCPL